MVTIGDISLSIGELSLRHSPSPSTVVVLRHTLHHRHPAIMDIAWELMGNVEFESKWGSLMY